MSRAIDDGYVVACRCGRVYINPDEDLRHCGSCGFLLDENDDDREPGFFPECYELAAFFLPNGPKESRAILAQHIQDEVDMWMKYGVGAPADAQRSEDK